MSVTCLPVWVAALVNAGGLDEAGPASKAIQWSYHEGRLRYRALASITVEPFRVRLNAGDELYVLWMPNETGYECEILRRGSELKPIGAELTVVLASAEELRTLLVAVGTARSERVA